MREFKEEKLNIGSNLSVIKSVQPKEEQRKKTMVAAYCRVSKDIVEQKSSIELQMEAYKMIILENPGWELAGIYADKGKTGTNIKKRPQFQKMIADAKKGKINMILAKSISRFARNTVDLLQIVRELRAIGVGVYFEKEKINTLSLNSEMLLSVYAAFAQEESFSISENMKRGIRQRFEIGIPKFALIYGLERTGEDVWEPKKGEAEVVKRIFESILSGMGAKGIVSMLNEEGIPSPTNKKWTHGIIPTIIRNEKYTGDCLMQKYYTNNHLEHVNVKNVNRVVNQYYKEGHHEAIVPRDVYQDANRVMKMRDAQRGAIQYPYYGRLLCPFCGQPMVKVPIPSGSYKNAWVCGGEDKGKGTLYTDRTDCAPYWIKEHYLDNAIERAIQELKSRGASEEEKAYLKKLRKELKDGRMLEFMDLKMLIKSMTFDTWDYLVITWNWGQITKTEYRVSRFVDYPDPTPVIEDGKYLVGGRCIKSWTVPQLEESAENIRNAIRSIHIIPDYSERYSCPPYISRDGKKPEPVYNAKPKSKPKSKKKS